MCAGREHLNLQLAPPSSSESRSLTKAMNNPTGTVKSKLSFSILLELAADNDAEGFKKSICNDSVITKTGLWYGRQEFLKSMVLEHRTPLMVAAKYGSVDVVKLILALPEADVNLSSSADKSTALHCAASGGSIGAVVVVKLLLCAGAEPNVTDAYGRRPCDVIVAPPNLSNLKVALEELLRIDYPACQQDPHVSNVELRSNSTPLPASPEKGSFFVSNSILSPVNCKPNSSNVGSLPEKKEYPIDPSFPDLKSSIYATDEFRMFSFKIRPCSRAYSHDWTECPFVHPGENARRRDPKKYHYSCVPCPEFRKGTCRRGDLCEYAHGVFECWLHPAQYRTRLCKDGMSCMRRVCFFAHKHEELRLLYASSGSALPSPQSATSAATVMDMAAALNMFPNSPSVGSAMSLSPFSPSLSPSGNGVSHMSMAWPQQNIPTLHLPGSNLQMSRLRSSLNARDISTELRFSQDFEMQQQPHLNDFSRPSQAHISISPSNLSFHSKTLSPSNLDELFSAEVSSPRYSDQHAASAVFSPSHKLALNQFQQQNSMLSPIKTNVIPAQNFDHPHLQASFGVSSPGMISPWSIEPLSPMGSRVSAFSHLEKHQQQLRSFSSRDLGSNLPCDLGSNSLVGSPRHSWAKWESHNGKVDWSVQGDELAGLRKSCSIRRNREEPVGSWVQSLVKELPSENTENAAALVSGTALSVEGSDSKHQTESSDQAVSGPWLEQLQIDQIAAQ
ncbi:zinc finger CCCH domain-containing protein 56-like [Carya illinoinensis]|uniref:C3H1-type domain-containing protein n=1 Tax=Carya illinoinensis TaxID=32201 RepID=A0A8T1NHR1_CARIL|nr:zinc finger CCCH domain-containing protein 56-like [Carya illinoinensis]XP_042959758.1 zinc finger CCCH domain-containing protein 56-like [Carya illinoinensis]KAG6629934.1 hypothetical protein CIPAW_14G119000 [Carya illinoinensis]KAG6629935.1 hypothetical protein CIPAW_14G119000 [Carya illinoinensis]